MSSNRSSHADAMKVLDGLIDGLRIAHHDLNAKSARALRGLGGRIVSVLSDVANDERTQDSHRRRLLATIAMIDRDQPIDCDAEFLAITALVGALGVHNLQLNDLAIAALACLRPKPVGRLIIEAVQNRQRPGYCVRLLQAVGQIGATPRASRHQDLFDLAADKHPAIRAAARRLISRFRLVKNRSQKRSELSA